jgi:hypothetical protein
MVNTFFAQFFPLAHTLFELFKAAEAALAEENVREF